MPKKKQKATYASSEPAPACHITGCGEAGVYKAPKSKTSLHEYVWYCLDHVRDYNKQWDYFAGMDRPEIEAFMRDALTGHRPTWPRESVAQYTPEKLQEALDVFLHEAPRYRSSPRKPKLSGKLREALAVMNMNYPFAAHELKLCYRALVKQFHPDVNKSDHQAEERFKRITAAYVFLNEHIKNQ